MSAPVLTWAQICRRRLLAQHLRTPLPAGSLHTVVGDICGLHAQVMSSTELSAAVRLEELARGTVAAALWQDRTLVKTWAQRGTLHLVRVDEYPLYVAALSNRRFDLDGPWLKYHGLTASDVPAMVDAVAQALDGRQLSREDLGREVVRLLGDTKFEALLASGWGAVLKPVAFQGQLCFGPSEGNRVSFVRPDQWIGPFERLDPEAALQEVARRFLAAYGPAQVEEFARWWGVTPKTVRGVLRAEHGFSEVEVDGKKAWSVWADEDEPVADGPVVRLLPLFDPYTVAVRHNGDRPLAGPEKDLVYRQAGWISPVLVVGGELVGVWEHTETKTGLVVDIRPFRPLDPAVAELAAHEAGRLGRHLGIAVTVTFSGEEKGFTRGRGRKNHS